jgi:phage gp29-like protein
MAKTSLLTDQIATRERSIDFTALGMMLPNPDPILKAQGKDIAVYRDMRSDALIGGCIRRRKSAVKALEWGLDRDKSASRVEKAVQAMLDDLDMERLIGHALEAALYGYQPMEVIWQKQGALIVPVAVEAKPPEWFGFDDQNQLRFKTKANMVQGEELPARKFLLPRQEPTYANPYGFADLSLCFWPLVFKKGGLKFWLAFTEKFGSAFSVGKLPRSATKEERAELLDSLEALIQDGVATIPDDGSVELVEMAGKSASADLYERLVMHCRGEIAIALLGQNQTTEATANKASATAGLEVTHELRDADAGVVAATVNQLIEWICELNFSAAPAPVFSLWDQEEQDKLQADRDKSNYEAGARFTNKYFMRAYGYQEGDLAEPAPPVVPGAIAGAMAGAAAAPGPAGKPSAPAGDPAAAADAAAQAKDAETSTAPAAQFAEAPAPIDPTERDTTTLMTAAAAQWSKMVDDIQTLVDNATSLAQLQQALTQAYGGLDSAELVRLMAAAMALAELKGLDAARMEALPASAAFAESNQIDPVPAQIGAGITAIAAAMTAMAARPDAPAPVVNVDVAPAAVHFAAPPAPSVQVDVHVPEQPAPTVEVTNQVQPAPVTVNNTHPARAVQTVERDANEEIVSTTTVYHQE